MRHGGRWSHSPGYLLLANILLPDMANCPGTSDISFPSLPGKLGGQDSFESIESYDSCDRLTQSWSSQSSFQSLQRVPSYDSFDSEDYPAALPSHKPKGTFKDYVRDRADMNKDKPVIPAAALAGYTGRLLLLGKPPFCWASQMEPPPQWREEPSGSLGCPPSVREGFWGIS